MSEVALKDGRDIKNYKPRKKKMWWRYLLMWFTGFLSCVLVIGIVGVLMGTVFKTGQVVGMFGLDANSLLQLDYQNKTILQLIMDLPKQKYETLGDIYKITPMAKSLIEDTVNPVLEKELHFTYNWEVISTKPFKLPAEEREDGSIDTSEDLSTYLGRAIKTGVYLSDFFQTGSIPSIVNLFLYPKDEHGNFDLNSPYCLMDYITAGETGFFDKIMKSVKVKDFIENKDDYPLLREDGGIGGWTLDMFTDKNIDGLSLSLFIDEKSTDPLMQELKKWTIGDLKKSDQFDDLSLSLFIGETDDPIMEKIASWTVGKVKKGISVEDFDDISLSAFIGKTTDPLLSELSKYNVGQLRTGAFVDDLSLGLLIGDTDDKFLKVVSTWTVGELKSDAEGKINNLSLGLFLPSDSKDKLIQYLSTLTIEDIKKPETFKQIKLADIIPVTSSSPLILQEIVKNDRTIQWLEETNLYNEFTVGQVFDTSKSTLMAALSGVYLADLEKEDTILNLTLGQVLPSTDPNSIVAKFSGKTLKELKNMDFSKVTLGELYTDEEIEANSILKALGKTTKISDLSDPSTLTKLHLGDILTDYSNPIINALKGYTINQIPSEINNLSIGTLVDVTAPGTPHILKVLATSTLNSLSKDINDLTLGQILDINVDSPSTTQLMKTLAGKKIDELNNFLSHIKLGDVMDFTDYPNLNNDTVKQTEINHIDELINTLKNHLKLKDVVNIGEGSPKILDTLKDEYLKDLPTQINLLTLGDFMEITPSSHPLLKALQGYTLSELETKIPSIQLNQIMTITEEGSHPLLWALRESTLSSLAGDIATKINSLTLGQVLTIDGSSHQLLQALQGTPISELSTAIPSIELGSIISTNSSSPQLLKTLVDNHVTISGLSDAISSMTLSQMITIDTEDSSTPQILIALKDVHILDGKSLVNKVNSLKLKDIYKQDDCVGVFKYLWDENNEGDLAISQIPSAVNNLPLTTLLEEYIYINDDTQAKYYDEVTHEYFTYSEFIGGAIPEEHEYIKYRRINAIYWFLLTESTENFSDDEKYYVLKKGTAYTINNGLGNITTNFSYHIKEESLFELYDAGLLDSSALSRSDLENNKWKGEPVGNLTMSEFIAICVGLLPSA